MADKSRRDEETLLQSLRDAEEKTVTPPSDHGGHIAQTIEDPEAEQLDPNRITIEKVRKHPFVKPYLEAANQNLKLIGYTEHGARHAGLVASISSNVLSRLNFPQRTAELAAIAGLLHDIGNTINREMHGQSGALMAKDILLEMGMDINELIIIIGAIGNHEEERGHAISPVAAALILADKADVHRSRVHNQNRETFDIHDRVNYAATHSFLRVFPEEKRITLEITIDTTIASVMDYFEIFLSRMIMCRRAAEFLGCRFGLEINQSVLI
jgi:metal-dependent HD superfamily phosphatase/phosphodiesterase